MARILETYDFDKSIFFHTKNLRSVTIYFFYINITFLKPCKGDYPLFHNVDSFKHDKHQFQAISETKLLLIVFLLNNN